MRDFLTIDRSGFPIIVAKYSAFVPAREEFLKAQEDLENVYKEHPNFVLLINLADVPYLPTEFRIAQAKWQQRMRDIHVRQQIRFVFYTPSTALQLLMKTVFTISTPGVPYTVVTTLDKAYAWARKQLQIEI